MTSSLSARLTRKSQSNFYYAFLTLPEDRRRGIYALYSFCRAVDDCVDEEGGGGAAGLDRWGDELDRCYAGRAETELGRELAETVDRFPIPRAVLDDIVAGCRMDLTEHRYATWADLRLYCERVASAVGLASIEIFGYTSPRTREYAVELGLALQLTNILRDVAPDAARGRLYLPLEDLARFGVEDEELLTAGPGVPRRAEVGALLAFEADRARGHYAAAAERLPAQDRRAMLAAEIMGLIYRAILEKLARRGYPIGGERVRVGRPRKAWIALRAAARVYGGS
ncbi:MAG: presqualene diphosphate synthase HpnD [Acidobacteriota bacterium]|jgi:phytoene synthase